MSEDQPQQVTIKINTNIKTDSQIFWEKYNELYEQSGKGAFLDYILSNKKYIVNHLDEFDNEKMARILELFIIYRLLDEFKKLAFTLKKMLHADDLYEIMYPLFTYSDDVEVHVIINNVLEIYNTNILLDKISELEFALRSIKTEQNICYNQLEKDRQSISNIMLRIEFLEKKMYSNNTNNNTNNNK